MTRAGKIQLVRTRLLHRRDEAARRHGRRAQPVLLAGWPLDWLLRARQAEEDHGRRHRASGDHRAPDARGGAWGAGRHHLLRADEHVGAVEGAGLRRGGTELTKPDPKASEISHRYPLRCRTARRCCSWSGRDQAPTNIASNSCPSPTAAGRSSSATRTARSPSSRAASSMRAGRTRCSRRRGTRRGRRSKGVEPQRFPFCAQIDNEGASAYAASPTGRSCTCPGASIAAWRGSSGSIESGKTEPLPVPERDYVSAAISPDGTRAAIHNFAAAPKKSGSTTSGRRASRRSSRPGGSSQAPVWTTDSQVDRLSRHAPGISQPVQDGGGWQRERGTAHDQGRCAAHADRSDAGRQVGGHPGKRRRPRRRRHRRRCRSRALTTLDAGRGHARGRDRRPGVTGWPLDFLRFHGDGTFRGLGQAVRVRGHRARCARCPAMAAARRAGRATVASCSSWRRTA